MIVSTSNIASTATITATPDSATQDINVIADGDFSSVYTNALGGSVSIRFVFSGAVNIGYIAIGGSNIAKKTSIQISTSATTNVVNDTLNNAESSVIMYKLDAVSVTSVTVVVNGGGDISIADISMGGYYDIPKGEQGGYKRPWTVPNVKARSAVGLDGSPINLSYESRSLKCTLSVPNNIMVDFDGWYNFINFASTNTFYVLEDLNKFPSYAGFNAAPAMTSAHGQTRSLGVSAITFNAFAKSTEALF